MRNNRLRIGMYLLVVAASMPGSANAVDLLRGQRMYNMHCAVCHGMNGVPTIQQAPSFANRERLMKPDMQLLQSVRMGKNVCPPFAGILKDDEIVDILQYARNLR